MSRQFPPWIINQFKKIDELKESFSVFPFDQPQDADKKGFYSCHQNDYMRLSAHPDVIAEKNKATKESGSGAMASIVYGGGHDHHSRFRAKVAEAAKSGTFESVLLTTCGWTANVGLIEAVAEPDMPIYIDMNAHASLWDGARLSAGRMIPIRHNRPNVMRSFIEHYGSGIIIIDAFYSTSGAICPLEEYIKLSEEFGCLLILDEAHSFGMIGEKLGGYAVELGLENRVHFRTVSLAKALGGNGGLIISNDEVATRLLWKLRPVIFSSSPPPANSAGNLTALSLIMNNPERAKHVQDMAALFRKYLNEAGVDTGPSACQIVSLNFKNVSAAVDLYGELKNRGILFSVFLAPAVPANTSLARFSIYAELQPSDIEHIAKETIDALNKLGLESKFPKQKKG